MNYENNKVTFINTLIRHPQISLFYLAAVSAIGFVLWKTLRAKRETKDKAITSLALLVAYIVLTVIVDCVTHLGIWKTMSLPGVILIIIGISAVIMSS